MSRHARTLRILGQRQRRIDRIVSCRRIYQPATRLPAAASRGLARGVDLYARGVCGALERVRR